MDIPLSLENPRIGDGDPKSRGRFRLNSGSEMTMLIPGLDAESPIRVVVDLESARFAEQRIVALYDHDPNKVVGFWERGAIASLGADADLHLIETTDPAQRELFPEAARIEGMLKANVPVEVSIGADPSSGGDWERVEAGAKLRANGRDYEGDGDLPLFILRNARIYEASIVTFGADSKTGRVAATRQPPVLRNTQMLDRIAMKRLLASHPKQGALIAGLAADDKPEAEIDTACRAAAMTEKDDEIAALKAANEKLCTEMSALKAAKDDEEDEDEDDAKAGKVHAAKVRELTEMHASMVKEQTKVAEALKVLQAAKGSSVGIRFKSEGDDSKPTTLVEAMEKEHAANPTLKGEKLRNHCVAKYGDLTKLTVKGRA